MAQAPAAFYFDLASPFCYLAAERMLHELALAAEWQPVLERGLARPGRARREHCAGDPHATAGAVVRERIERLAAALGLQPLRWPQPFPFDSEPAMRVASYAKQIGRAVPFAQAAFRQCYAGGRSLEDQDTVLIAAAACEMHPAAVLRAAGRRAVAAQLERATEHAAREGVRELPAIVLRGARKQDPGLAGVFQGELALEQAAAALAAGAQAAGRARGARVRLAGTGDS